MATRKKTEADAKSETKNSEVEKQDANAPDQKDVIVPEPPEETSPADEIAENTDAVEDAVSETEFHQHSDHAAETTPEPQADPAPAAERKGGAGAAIFGGAVAALIGVGVTASGVLDPILPASWRNADNSAAVAENSTRLGTLETLLEKQSGTIGALNETVSGLDDAGQSVIADGLAAIDSMSGTLVDLDKRLSDLTTRMDTLEKSAITDGISPEVLAAYESELTALQAAMAEQRAEVEQMLSHAAQSKTATAAHAALADVRVSVQNGGTGFAEALNTLSENGQEIPQALSQVAKDGVPTLASLRDSYLPAARNALAAARDADENSGGLSGFLQRQLGARSVAPKDGDSADAILSRAEAALINGQLTEALAELDALPEAAKAQMAEWIAAAQTRNAAAQAVSDLSQQLNTN